MSNNCLQTSLLSAVTGLSTPKLGEIIIPVKQASSISYVNNQQGLSITTSGAVKISVDGDGYFATTEAGLEDAASRMTEMTIPALTATALYFKNDNYNIHLDNKYVIHSLLIAGRNASAMAIFAPSLDDLKYSMDSRLIRILYTHSDMNLSSVKGHTSMKELALTIDNIYGKISDLPTVNTFDTLKLAANVHNYVEGSLAELAAMTGMKSITINDCELSGNLSSLSSLPVNFLDLGGTKVSGDISSLAVHASRITRIFLNDTQVTGNIADLGALSACTYLRFERTAVNGTIESVASAAAASRSSGTLIVDTKGSGITYNNTLVANRATITFTGSGNYTVAVS